MLKKENGDRAPLLIHLESVDSTNWEMRRMLESGEVADGTMVLADYQTRGHGRLGRAWESAPGDSLLFSVWAALEAPVSVLPGYSLLPALAVTDVLARLGVHAGCKWPNDIRVDGCKLCGILTECVMNADATVRGAVVGIGMNIRGVPDVLNNGKAPAYLSRLTDACPEAEDLGRMIGAALKVRTASWLAGERASQLEEWKSRCDHMGRTVMATVGGVKVEGVAAGLGDDGSLLLETAQGLLTVTSDDVVPA
ncbi:MAG: biotin--[acetyl-CoA-carboxylase] ligase [Mailhella sp.]|nr:biotin--[acetyl-CoA-carboxylase] ligase [Mailhella sp.]